MLQRNLHNPGQTDPSWWEELGYGAPTIAGFARLCSQALQQPDGRSDDQLLFELPLESKLILYLARNRGLKTFELRMQRHNENGQRIAEFLDAHPRVDRVYYPGLKSHPTHEIAASQMRGFGGLVTFTIKDADWKETSKIVDAAKIPRIAPSLGGVESLIEQPLG